MVLCVLLLFWRHFYFCKVSNDPRQPWCKNDRASLFFVTFGVRKNRLDLIPHLTGIHQEYHVGVVMCLFRL